MLPERMRASVLSIFAPPARRIGALQGLVWTPIRAAAGDPSAMLVWAAFGVAAFAFARVLFGERFAYAAAVAAGAPERAGGSTNRTARFSRSVGAALRAKERRVVWRDPWLKSQLLLQAAYAMPVAGILWRSGGPTGHGRRCLHSGPCRDRGAARGRAVVDRAVGRGCAGFSRHRSDCAKRYRTRQSRRHRPADRCYGHATPAGGAPQVNHAPIDFQVDLVQMPDQMRFGTALSQFRCNGRPE